MRGFGIYDEVWEWEFVLGFIPHRVFKGYRLNLNKAVKCHRFQEQIEAAKRIMENDRRV